MLNTERLLWQEAICKLLEDSNLAEEKIFAMAGHEGGIVSFGNDLDEAGQKLFLMLNM